MEWDEAGNPCSVVEKKNVKVGEKGSVAVGDTCSVSVCRGAKAIYYDAKVLGIGKFASMLILNYEIFIV